MTPQERKVLEMALEALELMYACYKNPKWVSYKQQEQKILEQTVDTITAIKEALAQPEQEPVACIGYWNQKTGAYYKPDQISMAHQKLIEDGILRRCYTTPQPDKLAYYEKVADDLQALCDKQSLRIAELEAQPEQEPVAYVNDQYSRDGYNDEISALLPVGTKLYTTPPQRKPLTDEEIDKIWVLHSIIQASDRRRQAFARAIEAAHGIKE